MTKPDRPRKIPLHNQSAWIMWQWAVPALFLFMLSVFLAPVAAQIPPATENTGGPSAPLFGNGPGVTQFFGSPTPSPGPAPTGGPSAPQATGATPISAPQRSASGSMAQFDPQMDNHLQSPAKPMGLFGLSIKEVESILREYGAKPYSYAFGKHSRMTFSVYVLTLSFDRNRKLGELAVNPRTPFTGVENQARQFLLQLFLKGADLNQFSTEFAPGSLKIKFVGPPSAKVTREMP